MVGVRKAYGNSRNCNADACARKVNFRAMMDHVSIGSFDITAGSQYLLAYVGGTARTMDCEQVLYFSLPLVSRFALVCRAPREISRLPRLAHKTPVMQASFVHASNSLIIKNWN